MPARASVSVGLRLQLERGHHSGVRTAGASCLPIHTSLRHFSAIRTDPRYIIPLSTFSTQHTHKHIHKLQAPHCDRRRAISSITATKMSNLYGDDTPDDVKNAKGLHLITQSTPNGQAVQIFLEELKDTYGIDFTTTVINIQTNVQKEDWFLRLNPNGVL